LIVLDGGNMNLSYYEQFLQG